MPASRLSCSGPESWAMAVGHAALARLMELADLGGARLGEADEHDAPVAGVVLAANEPALVHAVDESRLRSAGRSR